MAILSAQGYPLEKSWASNTSNIVSLTEEEKGKGIIYQSDVVSSFMNGALRDISNSVRWTMFGSAEYQENVVYDPGNCVRIRVWCEDVKKWAFVNYVYEGGPQSESTANRYPCKLSTRQSVSKQTFIVAPSLKEVYNTANTDEFWSIDSAFYDFLMAEFERIRQEIINEVNKLLDRNQPKWQNLGNVQGTFDLNLAPEFNCYYMRLIGATTFRNILTAGAIEKSGLIVILSGANHIQSLWSGTNIIYSFDWPFDPMPKNTAGGSTFICMCYYWSPITSTVHMTRV